jgi:hypothetical protein
MGGIFTTAHCSGAHTTGCPPQQEQQKGMSRKPENAQQVWGGVKEKEGGVE